MRKSEGRERGGLHEPVFCFLVAALVGRGWELPDAQLLQLMFGTVLVFGVFQAVGHDYKLRLERLDGYQVILLTGRGLHSRCRY